MRFPFILALATCILFPQINYAQEEDYLTVSLHPNEGDGPFFAGYSRLRVNDGEVQGFPKILEYSGDMEGFEEHILIPNNIQANYLMYINETDSRNVWGNTLNMYGEQADVINQVTKENIRYFIRLAVKEINDSEMVIWVDQNANDQWEEDEFYTYEKKEDDNWESGIARFPTILAQYQDVVEGQVETVEIPVQFAPFMYPETILFAYKTYNSGILKDEKGDQKNIYLSNGFTSNFFVEQNIKLFANESEVNYDETDPFQRDFYEFGEAITLGEDKYVISAVDKWGTSLKLRKLRDDEEWIGTQVGAKAPAILSKTLTEDAYHLYNGKVTMLDFWGSWCGPCVGEIPFLKDAVSFFEGDRFELVGIVFDQRATIEKFIESNNLSWKQVMHSYGQEDSDIVKVYNINAYPTTFLVGEDDKVIVKNDRLRGFELYKTLCDQMGIPEEDFIAHISKGDATLVFHTSNPNLRNIHITGGKFDKQKLYAYKSAEQYVRGFDWDNDSQEETIKVAYSLNGKQETQEMTLSKNQIENGKITIEL